MSQTDHHSQPDSHISVEIVPKETSHGEAPPANTQDMPTKKTSYDKSANKQAKKTNSDGKKACTDFCTALGILFAIFVLGPIVLLIISIPVTPLLLIFILLFRVFQLFATGEKYSEVTIYKFTMRLYMCFNLVMVLIVMGILYAINKQAAGLKHAQLIGLSIKDWIEIICMLSGFYLFNFLLCTIVSYVIQDKLALSPWETGQDFEVIESLMEGISCLFFWWAESETIKKVPAIKKQQILGLRVHKWIEVLVFIILGYNITRFVIDALVWLLWRIFQHFGPIKKKSEGATLGVYMCKKYMVYCAIGMRRSIIFLLTSVLVLLIWVLEMGSHVKETGQATHVFDFVTQTCVSILICSLLWLIKSCILLAWEAHAVYTRLSPMIVEKGKLLYFLALLSYKVNNILDDVRYSNCHWKIKAMSDHLFNKREEKGCTLYDLYQVTRYLLEAKNRLSDNTFINSKILNQFTSNDPQGDEGIKSKEELLKELINWQNSPTAATEKFWDVYKELLIKVDESRPQSCTEDISNNTSRPSREIYTMNNIESWVEASRKSCLSLAKSISCANELTSCLNKIISVFVMAAIFIMWLLLTGLATTQVLVLIASPLLAATFIFGDSCKTAFQGLMFVYVLEPFSIGDLCVIDGEMMEVNSIGVWKTTFTKVDSHQGEVIYPNSELMHKVVINHKTIFDWDDYLEFDATCLGKGKIEELKQGIEKYLEDQNINKNKQISHSVSLLATRECVKVIVRFKSMMRNSSWTFSDCHQKKEQLRSEIALHTKNLIEDLKELK